MKKLLIISMMIIGASMVLAHEVPDEEIQSIDELIETLPEGVKGNVEVHIHIESQESNEKTCSHRAIIPAIGCVIAITGLLTMALLKLTGRI